MYKSFTEINKEKGYVVERVDVLKTAENEIFISIYHRGSATEKLQKLTNAAMTAVENELKNNQVFKKLQFKIDHPEKEETIKFHPSGSAGQFENHYHIRSDESKPIKEYVFLKLFQYITSLQNGSYMNKELGMQIHNHFFPPKNLGNFFNEQNKANEAIKKKSETPEYSFMFDELF